jgi:DNA-binding transcriptional LysR family regulator
MQRNIGLEDLRLVRAIALHGSLTAAAAALGIDHSTAFRRLTGLERRTGTILFERRRTGYLPTPAGELAVAAACRIEDEFAALGLQIAGASARPEGSLKVTTTDTLVELLAPAFASFRRRFPGLTIELVVGNAFLDLARQDADVAIRPAKAVPDHLVGRRIATIATAPYAALSRDGEAAARGNAWIGVGDSLSHLASATWMRDHVPPSAIVLRANSLMAVRDAAAAGMGSALLPCFLGERHPMLRRIGNPDPAFATSLWLLTHPELRRSPRVRAFLDHMADELVKLRSDFDPGS